jgi:hypothetical protein
LILLVVSSLSWPFYLFFRKFSRKPQVWQSFADLVKINLLLPGLAIFPRFRGENQQWRYPLILFY